MKTHVLSQALRHFSLSAVSLTVAGAMLLSPAQAQTPPVQAPDQASTASVPAAALPDFTSIVEKADPAVVNIRTTATIPARGSAPGGRGPGGGADPSELFKWFFGPDFQGPGQGDDDGTPVPPQPKLPGKPAPGRIVPRGVGSGFFISSDGYILTNNHVVSEATDIFVTLTDGREFKAKVIGTDERTDVALIKIEAKDMASLPIGAPAKLKKGQWVLAIGSPFGLDSTVTAGIISAINRDTGEYLPFIQTDVAVNPGNSGGPLLNLQGEVVGINSQIVSRSGGFMGISLAIPIDEVMTVVDQLRATGRVTRGLIGVQIGEVTKEIADAIGLPKAEGAMVSSVQADGPADAAGVQPGDVILRFGTHAITRWSDLPRVVGETKPGVASTLEVWRRGKRTTLNVKVGEVPAVKVAAADPVKEKKAEPAPNSLGLALAEVPGDTQNKLRIKGGVLVRKSQGAAGAAGIAEGDILLLVNDSEITGVDQFNKLVAGLDKAKTVALLVRRGEQTQWVALQPTK
jgi:serine protease Do